MNILMINGPNLNLLGIREKEIYGEITLQELEKKLVLLAKSHDYILNCMQTNAEHEIINAIHDAKLRNNISSIIINPGAYTHTSIAIRDAILASGTPVVEVHLSNVYAREEFRHRSMIADVAVGKIVGFGLDSYLLGIEALIRYIVNKNSQ